MANKIYDAFEHVTADAGLKESTMRYLSDKRQKNVRRVRHPVQAALAAACMVVVLLLGMNGYSWFLAPVSYVSIDVNPSVELALNKLDRVVSATAYNKQGEELLKGMSLRGKKYIQAIEQIADSDVLRQYLNPGEELVLTVAADSSKEHSLKAGIDQCSSHIGHGCRSVSVDLDTASSAHGNGLSVGKYSAYLQLVQYDDSVTVDECKNMSMEADITAKVPCRSRRMGQCLRTVPTKVAKTRHPAAVPMVTGKPHRRGGTAIMDATADRLRFVLA